MENFNFNLVKNYTRKNPFFQFYFLVKKWQINCFEKKFTPNKNWLRSFFFFLFNVVEPFISLFVKNFAKVVTLKRLKCNILSQKFPFSSMPINE
jgi:hypothetical protein